MNVTRFADAPEYTAPNHFDMLCVRLQGREAGPAEQLWLGVSTLAPGGHTSLDASPIEKHYVVLEGELTLIGVAAAAESAGKSAGADGGGGGGGGGAGAGGAHESVRAEAVLGRFDSCRFAPGERRQLVNRSDAPARVLLAMPFEPPHPKTTP